jgi:hypothetical protein
MYSVFQGISFHWRFQICKFDYCIVNVPLWKNERYVPTLPAGRFCDDVKKMHMCALRPRTMHIPLVAIDLTAISHCASAEDSNGTSVTYTHTYSK